MNTVKATGEYGIVVRRAALTEKGIGYTQLLQAMEVEQPLDGNGDLVSFGPSFGEEAVNVGGFNPEVQHRVVSY
ncbi:hypothetical protein FACS1894154_11620 [Betaproteobacteria bacterium]|nr:hypothetical protein FACS1894154_11620 [Betaproteobacteria bacterium]GHU24257.1 hypothetical protein FACS189488_08520 [Betaproteobacteria bacterium]GHU31002.1 hypothetical protein FACS189497_11390 [Betaproteobacteria bacterium]